MSDGPLRSSTGNGRDEKNQLEYIRSIHGSREGRYRTAVKYRGNHRTIPRSSSILASGMEGGELVSRPREEIWSVPAARIALTT